MTVKGREAGRGSNPHNVACRRGPLPVGVLGVTGAACLTLPSAAIDTPQGMTA